MRTSTWKMGFTGRSLIHTKPLCDWFDNMKVQLHVLHSDCAADVLLTSWCHLCSDRGDCKSDKLVRKDRMRKACCDYLIEVWWTKTHFNASHGSLCVPVCLWGRGRKRRVWIKSTCWMLEGLLMTAEGVKLLNSLHLESAHAVQVSVHCLYFLWHPSCFEATSGRRFIVTPLPQRPPANWTVWDNTELQEYQWIMFIWRIARVRA